MLPPGAAPVSEIAVERGAFRADLFARLSSWRVEIPRLGRRKEDILRLARHFAGRPPEPRPGEPPLWTPDFAQALLTYPWPRNVRELRRLVSAIEVSGQHPPYTVAMLPPAMRAVTDDLLPGMPEGSKAVPDEMFDQTVAFEPTAEHHGRPPLEQLLLVLKRHGFNVSAVARHFARDRKQVYRWMKHYGIDAEPAQD